MEKVVDMGKPPDWEEILSFLGCCDFRRAATFGVLQEVNLIDALLYRDNDTGTYPGCQEVFWIFLV
jgi:hypothetical protein